MGFSTNAYPKALNFTVVVCGDAGVGKTTWIKRQVFIFFYLLRFTNLFSSYYIFYS